MPSRIGLLPAAVILLVAVCPSLAQAAPATATCQGLQETGTEFATCSAHDPVDDGHGNEVVGTGEATADLVTGVLKSHSIAQAYSSGTIDVNAGASAIANISDTITVGGGYSGIVELRMDVSGAFLLNDPVGFQFAPQLAAFLTTYTQTKENTASVFVEEYSGGGGLFLDNPRIVGAATYSADIDDLENVHVVLTSSFLVTPSTPTFSFDARLGTSSAISHNNQGDHTHVSEVNFGDTAHLSLLLPEGVPWTSGSGVFLAPEPVEGALLAVGLLCLSAARRKLT